MKYGKTFEGQRCADLGNGKYLNPIVPGDHADPTILKDGADYYMTFSSFQACPGVVIWHSRDLVNWAPLCAALRKPLGSVWAMDLVKVDGRYFIYIPAVSDKGNGIYVIYADNIAGPWSDPIDLHLDGCIDPGHAIGEDGKRYLFVNGIRRVRLSADGLSTEGELVKAYEPWRYPEDWTVEMFAPEGPKIMRKGDYFYLISAVGGTAGPATSHMVIAARSRSILGPWEDCPHNPIVHTQSEAEPWWSRGHATIVEGPSGGWWMVYHGYEKGFRALGRQTLLEPLAWTRDGWPKALGGDLSKPLKKPRGGEALPSRFPLSGPFTPDKMGIQWGFHNPGANEEGRLSFNSGELTLAGKGRGLADCAPLTLLPGDRANEAEVTLVSHNACVGGLALYYDERMFCGIGFDGGLVRTAHYGQEQPWMRIEAPAARLRLKLRNEGQVATWWYALDGGKGTEPGAEPQWIRHPWQMEVSGMNHNVFGGFTMLKLALFAAGPGAVTFSHFIYRGLD
jgi:xylan 1,4-beta-xylosidase